MKALRPALVFLVPWLAYLATGNTLGSADTRPARYLPFSLLREGDFDLDEFPWLREQPHPAYLGAPYYLRIRDGRAVSAFSPGPALLALPLYAAPVLAGVRPDSDWPALLEKLSAATLTALSVLALFLAGRRASSEGPALAMAAIYAFATSSFSASSQALWEHGPGQLCMAAALWLLLREDGRSLAAAGLCLGTAVLMRPTNALLAPPLVVAALWRRPRAAPRLLLPAALPLLFLAAYDTHYFGAPWNTGRNADLGGAAWAGHPALALAGLLVSPGRGLFVYSPVLIFGVAGLVLGSLRRRPLFPALAVSSLLLLAVCSLRRVWWGGWCYGPRLLADLLPFVCLGLLPVLEAARTRRRLGAAVLALALVSAGTHALGAVFNDVSWDGAHAVDDHPESLWSWRAGPIPHYAARAFGAARGAHAWLMLRLWPLPTSREAEGLAASYLSPSVPAHATAGELLDVRLRAFNSGGSAWLPDTPEGRGSVRLAWTWSCAGRELPEPAGRLKLAYPVLAGESVELGGSLATPKAPGDCTLRLGLVSELVAWFSDLGSPPLELPVRLEPVSRGKGK